MTHVKYALISLLFLCLIIFFGWYFGAHSERTSLPQATLEKLPDLYVYDLDYREYDTEGNIVKTLNTPVLTHVPRDNQFFLVTPTLHFKTNKENYIDLVAKRAFTEQGVDHIVFADDVHLSQPAAPHTAPFTMVTEQLVYFHKTEKVFTNTPVHFESQGHTMHAKGMDVDLTTQHITLHKTHATLVPSKTTGKNPLLR